MACRNVVLVIALIIGLTLPACGGKPTPDVRVIETQTAAKIFATQTANVPTLTNTPQPTATPEATATPVPTATPEATATPVPTATPASTNTPAPTSTPSPTVMPVSPTATPKPITLSGSGDSILDFENPFDVAIVHVKGNASSRYFAVTNYGSDGAQIDLLVSTTEPYDGIRLIDPGSDQRTSRFEVKASDKWEIQVFPLTAARRVSVPGTIVGKGDDVIILDGSEPDLAKIKGNAAGRYFAVIGYGQTSDLLVSTTDPYEGEVILNAHTVVLEVKAVGAWSIETIGR